MKTIVVGYDATGSAERALERAAGLAETFRARLVVVSAAPAGLPAPMGADPFLAPMPPLAVEPPGAASPGEEVAEQSLERARSALGARPIEVDYLAVVGDPAEELVAVAEQQEADLIVVGTREPGFLDRLLSGSVSQAVARSAHCDVLVVHPEPHKGG